MMSMSYLTAFTVFIEHTAVMTQIIMIQNVIRYGAAFLLYFIMLFFWKWNRKLKPTFVTLICIGVLLLLRNLAFDNSIYKSITLQQKKEYQLFSSFYRIRDRFKNPFQRSALRLNDLVVSTLPNKTVQSKNIVCQHPKLDLQSDTNKNAFYDVGSIQCFGSEIFSMENGKLKMDSALLHGDRIKQCTYQAIERIDDNYATYTAPIGGDDVNYPFNIIVQHDFIRVQCFLETKDIVLDSTRHLLSLSSRQKSNVNSEDKLHYKKLVLNANRILRYRDVADQSETTKVSKITKGDKDMRKRPFTDREVRKGSLLNNALKFQRNNPRKLGNKMVRSSFKTSDVNFDPMMKYGVKALRQYQNRNKPSLLLSTNQRSKRNNYKKLGSFPSGKVNNLTSDISLKVAFKSSNKSYKNNPIASMKSKFTDKFRHSLNSVFNGALYQDKNGSLLANITAQNVKKIIHQNAHSSLKLPSNINIFNSNSSGKYKRIPKKLTYPSNNLFVQNQQNNHSKGISRFLKTPDVVKSLQIDKKNHNDPWKRSNRIITKTKQKHLLSKKRSINDIISSSNGSILPKSKPSDSSANHQSLPQSSESEIPQLMLLPTISKLNSLIYPENQIQVEAKPKPKSQEKDVVNVKFLNSSPMKSRSQSHPNIKAVHNQLSSHPMIQILRPKDTYKRFPYTTKSKILPNNLQIVPPKLEKPKRKTEKEKKSHIFHNFDIEDMTDTLYYDNSKETYLNLPPEQYGIYNQLPDIEQFFVQIYPKPEVFQRISDIPQFVHLNTIPLNILIYGLDSLSHLSFQRKLPLSYKHLKESLGAIIMNGYNIVGDATAAAIIPLLTGRTETELPEVRKNQLTSGFVDDYPLVWNKFRSKGYVTLFAEDCPSLGVFNLRFNGFYNAPTDHYMRPFWQAISESVLDESSINFCLGSKPKHQFTLDYLKDFFQKYANVSKFAFAFHGELSHNDNNPIQYLDKDLLAFFQSMEKGNYLNNTLLIVMSDHGARYGSVRNTVQGKLEERLPFMSFVFPKWFQLKYSYFMKNLKSNQERLVTPFDVHETMLDILDSTRMFEPVDYSTRGLSLLQPIPLNRTCKSAGIAMHWCSCLSRYPVDPSTQLVHSSMQKVMSYIRTLLLPVKHLCGQLSLKKIFSVYLVSPNEKVCTVTFKYISLETCLYFTVRCKHILYNGLYEASVKVNLETQNFQVFPEISRLNKYGDQPNCISEKFPDLRKYCYCMNV
ncbi:uncharacterized protein LOC106882747 [Octopus bimaculoides]|uniref:uncharacterized protein LOC106882747 n=1 Tax=Octopus bimaculoides TaxID=37653 RepID=UPI0022DEC0B8|nr:uncharacterized protein LOC106882747 [Octopus bimaculoides]